MRIWSRNTLELRGHESLVLHWVVSKYTSERVCAIGDSMLHDIQVPTTRNHCSKLRGQYHSNGMVSRMRPSELRSVHTSAPPIGHLKKNINSSGQSTFGGATRVCTIGDSMLHDIQVQFKNNYFTEMCNGSEAGSYLRRIDLCITQLWA